MKVNPIGIQTYQQLNRKDNQTNLPVAEQQTKAVDKQLSISPQEKISQSKLAVKANSGDYSQYLTPEERNALDILFARYKETGRFGPTYQKDANQSVGNNLGRTIDVKV